MTLSSDDLENIKNMMTFAVKEAVKAAIEPINERFDRLETRFDVLETRFDRLETRFDVLETRFDVLETRFDVLETRFGSVETYLRIIDMKSHNASNRRHETLSIVPLSDGTNPTCEYPESICNLIVSGSELLPGRDITNNWNKTKSLNLIKQYQPDYNSDAESDNEDSSRSRNRRLKVAKLIGITSSQLNFAQLSL